MSIISYFNELVDKFKIRSWSEADKSNLFRVLLEVYHSDGVYSEDEQKDFTTRISGLGLDLDKIEAINFEHAINSLKSDTARMEIIYFWIASAVFSDEDYDKTERAFIDDTIVKYQLDGTKLKSTIKEIRDQKIDKAINSWYSQIERLF